MDEIKKSMKDHYKDVHPLIFHRLTEYLNTDVEIFDILHNLPECPFVWDFDKKCFVTTDLLMVHDD